MDNLGIIQAMSSCNSLSVTDLYEVTVDLSELDASEIEFIEQHGALPLFKRDGFLFVVLTDIKNITSLSQLLNLPIKTVIVAEEELNNMFFTYQYDYARLTRLLEGNQAAASLVINRFLTPLNARAMDCYLKKTPYNPFFKKWNFWNIGLEGCLPMMDMTFAAYDQVAVSQEHDNLENGLRLLVIHEPIHITSEEKAIDYLYFFFEFCATSVATISPEDIEYFCPLEEEVARWDKVIQQITEFQIKREADGYIISLWLMKQTDLYQGVFKIDGQGVISSTLTLVEPNIAFIKQDILL